ETEPGHHRGSLLGRIREAPSTDLAEEDLTQPVPMLRLEVERIPEDLRVPTVPGDEVEGGGHEHRRTREEPLDEVEELRAGRFGRSPRLGDGRPGQAPDVATGVFVQLEHTADRVEERGAHTDVATLLEPRVPRVAHPREGRDLAAPQPSNAAPGLARDADG